MHLISADADGSGLKSINFTSDEGAVTPERVPVMVYSVAVFPPPGTRLMLK